jgi:hypothetical protein
MPTSSITTSAGPIPAAVITMMVRIRPPIMIPVPSEPSPPIPAEAGWRQFP